MELHVHLGQGILEAQGSALCSVLSILGYLKLGSSVKLATSFLTSRTHFSAEGPKLGRYTRLGCMGTHKPSCFISLADCNLKP